MNRYAQSLPGHVQVGCCWGLQLLTGPRASSSTSAQHRQSSDDSWRQNCGSCCSPRSLLMNVLPSRHHHC